MFRDDWRVIEEHVVRGHVEHKVAKEIPAIAACIIASWHKRRAFLTTWVP
jgi:hypothetical protein